jgi:hypothetical protein
MYAPIPETEALQQIGMFPKGTILPPSLPKTSDLVFLNYCSTEIHWPGVDMGGGSKIPCPKYFIIPFIDNTEVSSIFSLAFKKTPGIWYDARIQPAIQPAPGVSVEPESEAGMAILGIKHGAAVSFFLFQRKKQLGLKVVWEIRVWHEVEGGGLSYYLYFGVGDDVARAEKAKRGDEILKARLRSGNAYGGVLLMIGS